jgi:predicted nuclease of predicted toxin-antitoxin system
MKKEMRFIADESVDRAVVECLREKYDVLYIAEAFPGVSDKRILALCHRLKSILITADKDFGELVYRFGRHHYGVILYRLPGIAAKDKAAIVCGAIYDHVNEVIGSFTVITRDKIRIRKRYDI